MHPAFRRFFGWLFGIIVLVLLCLLFPRVLAFVELAARELRYLWWLILMVAIGAWLVFFRGRRKP